MTTNLLDKYRTQRSELADQIEATMSGENFDPADKDFVEARSTAESLDSKIKAILEWQSQRNAANELDAISVRSRKDTETKQTRQAEHLTIGEAWTRSKAYENYRLTPKGNSQVIDLPFDSIQTRAPILTTTFAGLIQPDRIAPSSPPAQQTPLLDLISRVAVAANSVEWIFYPAAAPLGTVTAEGVAKTEAVIAPLLKTVTLDTIASWAQYSRQFGEDAPGLVDFLNAALARGINDKREALTAAALVADAGIIEVGNPATGAGATDSLLKGIRRAIGAVQAAGYQPNAVVLNPADFALLDIDVLGKTMLGPQVGSQFWGVRPVASGAIVTGTVYVGDFTTGMVELVRRDVSVYTTDSHASTFTSNVLTTLVEARTKPIVHRPEAIVKVKGVGTALDDAGATTSAKK